MTNNLSRRRSSWWQANTTTSSRTHWSPSLEHVLLVIHLLILLLHIIQQNTSIPNLIAFLSLFCSRAYSLTSSFTLAFFNRCSIALNVLLRTNAHAFRSLGVLLWIYIRVCWPVTNWKQCLFHSNRCSYIIVIDWCYPRRVVLALRRDMSIRDLIRLYCKKNQVHHTVAVF